MVSSIMNSSEYSYGYHAIKSILQVRPQDILKLYVLSTRDDKRITEIIELAQKNKLSYKTLNKNDLNKLIGEDKNHQGVIAECKPAKEMSEAQLIALVKNTKSAVILILDGVQDPHNLGACLRSANAFGVTAMIIPKDRAARLTEVAKKAASGAAEITPLVTVTNLHRIIKQLQEAGVWFVGLDSDATLNISAVDMTGSIGIIMGGEGQGMRRLTRECCDYLAQIPMCGNVESLNVSVATGVSLYEMQRQRNKSK